MNTEVFPSNEAETEKLATKDAGVLSQFARLAIRENKQEQELAKTAEDDKNQCCDFHKKAMQYVLSVEKTSSAA